MCVCVQWESTHDTLGGQPMHTSSPSAIRTPHSRRKASTLTYDACRNGRNMAVATLVGSLLHHCSLDTTSCSFCHHGCCRGLQLESTLVTRQVVCSDSYAPMPQRCATVPSNTQAHLASDAKRLVSVRVRIERPLSVDK